MLEAIRRFVTDRVIGAGDARVDGESLDSQRRVQLAACALLLELAYADDEFTSDERRHIETTLGRHFDLAQDQIADLLRLAEAERVQSLDHFQFTRLIAAEYDLRQKVALAEVMWGVILADGRLSDHETHLIRKMASLMQLEPAYLAQARRSAAEKS